MRLADVLTPAICYARDGQPLVERASATIGTVEQLFREHWPTSAAVYLPGGKVPAPGTLFTNKQLAETYARILREAESAGGDRDKQIEHARKMWSHGFVAEAIDRFCRTQELMDTSGERHRGVLTADDMARWQPRIEAPVTYDYGRYTVCKGGFWSQGPVMLQQLALLKGFDLDGADPTSADFIHTVVECAKLAFADRDTFYGDPDFVEVPGDVLLSDAYNAAAPQARRRATPRSSSGRATIPGYGMRLDIRVPGGKRLAARRRRRADGRAHSLDARRRRSIRARRRSATAQARALRRHARRHRAFRHHRPRTATWCRRRRRAAGCNPRRSIPELGFCLGTRAQQFWLDEGHPAALAPGKRPRTTLTPTMALRDGEPYLAWGSPGGDQQDQWIAQFFLRHVHCGMNLQEAIDAPAWHSEHFPSSFWPREARPGVLVVEGRLPPETIKELRRRGHVVEVGPDWSEGRLTAASREGRRRRAAANPRGMQGYAAGR